MRAKDHLSSLLRELLAAMDIDWPLKTLVEPPQDSSFGDLATNLAMLAGKAAGVAPRTLAAQLAEKLKQMSEHIIDASVAGPGFINVAFAPSFWHEVIPLVEEKGAAYGSCTIGAGRRVLVEFVSANPTGPLHIGHGRGAAVGDSLAQVLRFAGFDVQTEYYVNDAGRQMRLLGLSVWLRALELAGRPVAWPEDWYKGSYIIDIARELLDTNPSLADLPEKQGVDCCFAYAAHSILTGIKKDLADFHVHHDSWFSEHTLVDTGAVAQALDRLAVAGRSYEQDGALWFRTSEAGDDRDRVLRKSDGSLTYFASDIAYHKEKYDRRFDLLVDIWGADHHGYIPRMRAAVAALEKPQTSFEVILIQLVNLLQGGEQIAMSTRAGQFETLADVVREVGADAARFMFLTRKSDSPLDFDLDLVKEHTMDNPVYYVQYAHARIHAVLRKAQERGLALPAVSERQHLSTLTDASELTLLRLVERFDDVVAGAATKLAPHHISYYLMNLAGELHSFYATHKVLHDDAHTPQVIARLALLRAVGVVLANGLALLGVSAPESMRHG